MAGSSKIVNYYMRPNKSIERKIMCEMIAKLKPFCELCEYRYIGMGAKHFVDFTLMHKEFGITNMFSMEIDSTEESVERFNFNKPYGCIDIKFGSASDLLSSTKFEWKDQKNIIWLDYDGGFSKSQIMDVETCMGKMESGSTLFVSFNSNMGDSFKKKSPNEKLSLFIDKLSNDGLTNGLTNHDMAGDSIKTTMHRMFDLIVKDKVSERNATILNPGEKLNFKQIAFFEYSDSKTVMLTIGWLLYKESDTSKYEKCKIEESSFFNPNNEPFDISVPNLTYKELSVLNQNMPNGTYPIPDAAFFTEEEIEAYKKVYRHFPTMFESSTTL